MGEPKKVELRPGVVIPDLLYHWKKGVRTPILLTVPPEGHSPVKGGKILIKLLRPLETLLDANVFYVKILPAPGRQTVQRSAKAVVKEGLVGFLDPKFAHLLFPRSLVATGPSSYVILPMLQLYQEPITKRISPLSLGKHLAALAALSWHTGIEISDLKPSYIDPNLGQTVFDLITDQSQEPSTTIYSTLESVKSTLKFLKRHSRRYTRNPDTVRRLASIFKDYFKRFVESPNVLYAYLRDEREKLYRVLRNLGYEIEDEWHTLG